MPIMDGYEAAAKIRELNEVIPIIALTANAMTGDEEKTQLSGMNEHLSKPIEVEKLFEVLLRYLSGKSFAEIKPLGMGQNQNSEVVFEGLAGENYHLIDLQKGLANLAGNEKLYIKVLQGFVDEFQGVKLDFKGPEGDQIIHTLKGLSGNIGAHSLYEMCKELEERWDEGLMMQLNDQLREVIEEIVANQTISKEQEIELVEEEIVDELLSQKIDTLKIALSRRRSRECLPVIEEIKHYQLNQGQRELFDGLAKLVQARDFKAGLALLEGGNRGNKNDSGSR